MGVGRFLSGKNFFSQLTNKTDFFFQSKRSAIMFFFRGGGGDYFTPLGSGTHLNGIFLNKEHPAFHSGFFFVKCLLLCSVLPALADNIESTIIVEVG